MYPDSLTAFECCLIRLDGCENTCSYLYDPYLPLPVVLSCAGRRGAPEAAPVPEDNADSLRRMRERRFAGDPVGARAFRMTCVGAPLVAAGLAFSYEDGHFRALRNGFIPSFHSHVDDHLQYAPAAVMLGMKAGGVESRSSWGRMLVSDSFSAVLLTGVVLGIKRTTHVVRPDGANAMSFPSGHTATAFMTATMLTKEYGHLSPWVGVGAYTAATATGFMRLANDRHWFSDVLAGAGFGILVTELGYLFTDLIFKEKGLICKSAGDLWNGWEEVSFAGPSFIGTYFGVNFIPGSRRASDGMRLRFRSGGTAGVEGAYFFLPYAGVGGRIGVSDMSAENPFDLSSSSGTEETLDLTSVYAGAYFSMPLAVRLALGGNLSAGYVHTSVLNSSRSRISREDLPAFDAGISLTFKTSAHFGLRVYADCEMMPSLLSSGHLFVMLNCGGAVSILL